MTYQPDLAAYFARLDYRGPRELTVDTLHALSRAHVSTIPFENADVLLGAGVDLDPAAVEAKLVGAGRGGYCFEQNSLFLRVLQALGFAARPLSAGESACLPLFRASRDLVMCTAYAILINRVGPVSGFEGDFAAFTAQARRHLKEAGL